MLEQCEPPTALSKPVSCMEKKFCSPSSLSCVSMRCLCNPDRTCFFFFCHPFARPPCPSLLRGGGCFFSHPGLPLTLDSSTTGLHSSNRVENPSCRCCAPTRFSKPHAGPQRAFLFHAHSLLAFTLRGKANLFPNLACPGFLDSLTTAPHGSNRAGNPFCWCRFPTRFSKPHTGPHRGKSCFTDFSSRVFVLAEPQNPASGCNLPPLGWVILAKIFSLFSPPQILRWPSLSFGYAKGLDFSRTIHKNSIPDHIFFPLDKKKHRSYDDRQGGMAVYLSSLFWEVLSCQSAKPASPP